MIQIENITKSFGERLLYEDISLAIAEGSRIALIAKNGEGKTTLLNIIARKDTPDSGSVVYRNDISVGYLMQEPEIDGALSVMDAIYNHSESHVTAIVREYEDALSSNNQELIAELIPKMDSVGAWDFESRAKEILSRLKIDNLQQMVSTLSGGQKKRVALAMILIGSPDLLILDEPTNHLDLEMSQWLEDYLIKSNITLFMVTHDRYFLDRVCTDIYELDHSQIFQYKGNYSTYVKKRSERIEQFNTEVTRAQNLYRRELEWMRRMPQARSHKSKYRQEAFYDIKDKAFATRNDSKVEIALAGSRLGTKIFEVKDLDKSFGDKRILNKFSYIFNRYEKLGIVGKNGSGKSTFLNILTGSIAPDSGIVDIGESVKFGYYCQQGVSFDENLKVIDVIKEIAEFVTLADGNTISASQLLNHFLFTPDSQYNYIYKLSGGERRRLYLLTILMQNPNFLILDEPTNDLDIITLNVLEEFLENFGGCLMVVSHDRYFMDKVVDHLLIFEGDGKLSIFEGNYTQYRNNEEIKIENARNETSSKTPISSNKSNQNVNGSSRKDGAEEPRKLTYKEKRELEEIEANLKVKEGRLAEIEVLLAEGTLSIEELTELSSEHGSLSAEIDEITMRWLEISM